jgi:hypothetical protein
MYDSTLERYGVLCIVSAVLRASHLKDMDLERLPALVYQLFLLCTKSNASISRKLQIIRLLLEHFNALEAKADTSKSLSERRRLSATEGTVLFHFSFSLKQDLVCVCS